ncbi:predicted protein [Sparassis crispa]|uniref:Cytochrome P450 n=1 Tax=Sparassis crispa TaxID=139825 RepID=A0A401H652_9APHY|nr:predicted protein [Sparassis crispa]GBE89918.1 predicted protein [Sparassis crispa]
MDTSGEVTSVHSRFLCAAAIAGLLTWICLKRQSVRGNHAAIGYCLAFSSFYLANKQLHTTPTPLVFTCLIFGVHTLSVLLFTVAYRLSPFHPLFTFPGPRLWWISSLRLGYVSFKGKRHLILDELHKVYGPFVRIGPNTLSINTLSAAALYNANYDLDKSEAYNTPGHLPVVAIFFKQRTKKLHADRKRIWSTAFTGPTVVHFFPLLERRTMELMKCIEWRQTRAESKTVDLSECLCHWSYDFMGDMAFGGCNDLELMKRGDPDDLVMGGKRATIALDRHVVAESFSHSQPLDVSVALVNRLGSRTSSGTYRWEGPGSASVTLPQQ